MECGVCKETRELNINTVNVKICDPCILSFGYMKLDVIELKNNVLFYIKSNSERSGCNPTIQQCSTNFVETDITKAKDYLLSNVIEMVKVLNVSLASDVSKSRIGTTNHSKHYIECTDI